MPDALYYPVGTVTCIMVFKEHKPHDATHKTWFGHWKDDGFVKAKNVGRLDKKGVWDQGRERWLEQFREGDSVAGECVKTSVQNDDEWCAEAYLETDYSKPIQTDFEAEVRKFLVHELLTQTPTAPVEDVS